MATVQSSRTNNGSDFCCCSHARSVYTHTQKHGVVMVRISSEHGREKKPKKTIKLNYGLEARNMAPLWDRAELCALERERERKRVSRVGDQNKEGQQRIVSLWENDGGYMLHGSRHLFPSCWNERRLNAEQQTAKQPAVVVSAPLPSLPKTDFAPSRIFF